MKVIPTKELIVLLEHCDRETLNSRQMENIYKRYGDDYYIDEVSREYELCKENPERKEFLRGLS